MGGFMIPSGGSGSRSRRRRTARPMADINVTPFVDVMLVLLIVFMVTAPMMTMAVPVDLPKTEAKTVTQDKEPLILTVASDGKVYLQKTAFSLEAVIEKLKAITGANPETRIFVYGDKSVPYGKVVEVMGAIGAAGFSKVALAVDLPKPSHYKTK